LTPHDIERIVFVGGPSQYKPLRDKVVFELGIAASTDVNPMTAVAEGAAIFAESIDLSSQSRGRKTARGTVSAGGKLDIALNYISRTPDVKAKVAIKIGSSPLSGSAFQVDSLDTGWSSGRMELKSGLIFEVPLLKAGENSFKIFVFDPSGGPISLGQDKIVITRTAATVDAIPASHSIGIEVRDRIGGSIELAYLIRKSDPLPARGQLRLKAAESLRAGSANALNFIIREGEIERPVSDNRFVGLFEINGTDFDDGVVPAGSDLLCEYEILDSGNIVLEVSIPSIGGTFNLGRNFYSRKEAEIDFTAAAKRIREDAARTGEQISELERQVRDPSLVAARKRLSRAKEISPLESNPETAKEAMDDIQKAKEFLAKARKTNLKVVRQMELDGLIHTFEKVKQYAKSSELSSFEVLAKRAERAISDPTGTFESCAGQLSSKIFMILARQDWFIVDRFNWYVDSPHLFADLDLHARLVAEGKRALASGDVAKVRTLLCEMDLSRVVSPEADDLLATSNILRG
jgi:molecular chaperone DnaK